jgi:putative Ig domain-containing protein
MKPGILSLLLVAFASRCAASSVAITTTSLPNGTVNTAYSAVIGAKGGCIPYKWAITSGALPAGVTATVSNMTQSLNLTGTPTSAATDSLTVKVTGCRGHVSQVSYKVVIQATANHIVDLNWKASAASDVAGYNVYRGLAGGTWQRINASLVTTTLYSDSTVANSTTYYYATTAVDVYGNESNKSAYIEAIIP